MPVSDTARSISYTANGITAIYAYPFKILQAADCVVYFNGVVQSSGFTITGIGNDAGGSVLFSAAPASGVVVKLSRIVTYDRTADYQVNGAFREQTVDADQDLQTMQIQQLKDFTERSLHISSDVEGVDTLLPTPSAGGVFAWNATGTGVDYIDPITLVTLAAAANFKYKITTGNGTAMLVTLDDNPGALANLDVSVNGVTKIPITDYTLSGNGVQFVTTVANGATVFIRYGQALPQGFVDQSTVLNSAEVLTNYAALDGYSGSKSLVYLKGSANAFDGGHGYWAFDSGASGAEAANVGTKRRDSLSRMWRRQFTGSVNAKWFNATGDGITNDTAAVNAAIVAGSSVYAPAGTYVLTNVALKSNLLLYGDGQQTIFLQAASTTGRNFVLAANKGDGGTSSETDNIRNLYISRLQLQGRVASEGFSEQTHLVHLTAVSNVSFKEVGFYGFKGDALYIGSGDSGAAVERHNYKVYVTECYFDGVNKDNRNCISIIDGTDVFISRSEFKNSTRSDMPGAIDLEPENNFNRIDNINAFQNSFRNIGGTSGVTAYFATGYIFTQPSRCIKFYENTYEDCDNAYGSFSCQIAADATTSSPSIDFEFMNNSSRNMIRIGVIIGSNGIRHIGNTYIDCNRSLFLGVTSSGSNANIESKDNTYIRVGKENNAAAGCVFEVSTNNYLLISDTFVDCGRADGTTGHAVRLVGGTTTNFNIRDCTVTSPNSKTTKVVHNAASHVLTPETNSFNNNNIRIGGGNDFFWKSDLYSIYTSAATLASLPEGVTYSSISGDAGVPSAQGKGLIKTEKFRDPTNLNYAHTAIQWFFPTADDIPDEKKVYFRKVNRTTGLWDTWRVLTGV